MKDPKKLAIVVLVVVAVLFIGAMTTGAFSGEGSSDPDAPENDFVSAIGDRVGAAATIDPATVDAPCRDDDVADLLVITGVCQIRVPGGGEGLRLLRLQAQTPVRASAPAPDEDADFEVTASLDAGERAEIAVGEEGADITFACPGLAQCAVLLLAEE
jgi:hypothetical protein